jgi:hypothetical protein
MQIGNENKIKRTIGKCLETAGVLGSWLPRAGVSDCVLLALALRIRVIRKKAWINWFESG